MELLLELFHDYFRRLHQTVLDADEDNSGRGILGTVEGRESSEDVEIGIDEVAYKLFADVLAEYQADNPGLLNAWVRHEHDHGGSGTTNPDIRIDLDPIDGSDEYLRKIRNSVYSVVCARDAETLQPLAAATLDVHGGMIYSAGRDGRVSIEFLRSGRVTTADLAGHTALADTGVVGAVYVGRMRYLTPWMAALQEILSRPEHAGIALHGKGGSFVYAFIAAGVFSFYVMPDEPVDEILPGLAFAELAGFPVLVREGTGDWVKFDIKSHGELERVPFLVVACTNELADELTAAIDQMVG